MSDQKTTQLIEEWESIKEHIRREYGLTGISYSTWIKNLKPGRVEGNTVTILIPSDQSYALSYISGNFKDYFKVTISELFDEECDVSFILEKDAERQELPVSADNSELLVSANLNPRYRFDNFIVGSNNKFAHSASVAVAESPGQAYNPLFLYGSSGLGKTHLMHSIGHYILQENPSLKVLYVTSEQFTNEVIESIRSGNAASMSKLRNKYRNVDVLLIDDIQFIIGKESTQEEFFNTFNVLHTAGKQIVISSDKPPKSMDALDDRFRSRFEWGLTASIQAPDYETRMAILRRDAEKFGIPIPNEILEYIASNIKSNVRELSGALNKIVAKSKIDKADITMADAEEILKDIISPDDNGKLTLEKIANTVCEHYQVSFANVASKKKNAELVLPRQVIMYICREYTDSTYENVAHLLQKKDHSTIIHGVDKIKDDLVKNDELRDNVDNILQKLNIKN